MAQTYLSIPPIQAAQIITDADSDFWTKEGGGEIEILTTYNKTLGGDSKDIWYATLSAVEIPEAQKSASEGDVEAGSTGTKIEYRSSETSTPGFINNPVYNSTKISNIEKSISEYEV